MTLLIRKLWKGMLVRTTTNQRTNWNNNWNLKALLKTSRFNANYGFTPSSFIRRITAFQGYYLTDCQSKCAQFTFYLQLEPKQQAEILPPRTKSKSKISKILPHVTLQNCYHLHQGIAALSIYLIKSESKGKNMKQIQMHNNYKFSTVSSNNIIHLLVWWASSPSYSWNFTISIQLFTEVHQCNLP